MGGPLSVDGRLLVEFVRPLHSGSVPLRSNGGVFLWATGYSAELFHHKGRGAFTLNMETGEAAIYVTKLAIYKSVHGGLMLLGWGVLLPFGILCARYLKHRDPLWFQLHRKVQLSRRHRVGFDHRPSVCARAEVAHHAKRAWAEVEHHA